MAATTTAGRRTIAGRSVRWDQERANEAYAKGYWVGETLAYFKVPTQWEIREQSLPRNAVGKVMKHLLGRQEDNPFTED